MSGDPLRARRPEGGSPGCEDNRRVALALVFRRSALKAAWQHRGYGHLDRNKTFVAFVFAPRVVPGSGLRTIGWRIKPAVLEEVLDGHLIGNK